MQRESSDCVFELLTFHCTGTGIRGNDFFFSHSITQIIMLDAARLQPQRTIIEEKARLTFAINRIRSMPGFASMPIVLIPEDGPPGAGEKLWFHVQFMNPIICMTEAGSLSNGQHRFGVPKTQDSTIQMKDMLLEFVGLGNLCFSTNLFSLEHVDKGEDVASTLKKLQFQMYNYRHLMKKKYEEYHNDDLLIALMQLLAWSDKFIKQRNGGNQAYRKFHQDYVAPRR